MSSQDRVLNFSAGPSVLPLPVLEECASNMLNCNGSGQSVLEMSHRSPHFQKIYEEAQANLRAVLQVPENYHIFFLQGGATMQFSSIPFNFRTRTCPAQERPQYLVTGGWSKKALVEAKRLGQAEAVYSNMGKEGVPGCSVPDWNALIRNGLNPNARYLYMCVNETVHGCKIALEDIPYSSIKAPIIADVSSCFLSEPMDISKFAVVYAGAQKNAGPAGLTVVIIRDDIIGNAAPDTPVLLDWATWKKKPIYNTPSCYSIYVHGLVMRWLRYTIGGLQSMHQINVAKANLVYDVINDPQNNGFYVCPVDPNCRSIMNIRFNIGGEDGNRLEKLFVSQAEENGMFNLKGHRSLGGCRASLYNAQSIENCARLAAYMREFRARHQNCGCGKSKL